MNTKKLCVFDFESDGRYPEFCNPVQLSAIIIDPRSLKLVEGAEFNSNIRPDDMDKENYVKDHQEVIAWHSKNHGCQPEDIVQTWENSPSEKLVWKNFVNFLAGHHDQNKKSQFQAPIPCGHNILRFDMVIINRLCKKYKNVDKEGNQNIFYMRDTVDLMHWMFACFENRSDLKSYSMDVMRDYFDMKRDGAHDSLVDVKQTAELIVRFMGLFRKNCKSVSFKGSIKGKV